MRRVSWVGLVIGLLLGLGVSLFYTWVINPVIEYNTAPWQLGGAAREQYIVMAALAFQNDRNLDRAGERLRPFDFDRPGVEVARVACDFFRRAEDPTLTAALVDLARAYGEATCADIAMPATGTPPGTVMIVVPTETPTRTPTPTQTPTPLPTDTPDPARITPTVTRTPTPAGSFEVVSASAFCNARFSGVIEVYVRERDGTGIPGVEVQVTWAGGSDRFFTGLLPDEDPGYANFVMEEGRTYRVQLPGRSSPSRELTTQVCDTEGEEAVLSGYAVVFQR